MKTKIACLLTVGLMGTWGASAADIYVAKNGNNSSGDGSINNPYLTVQKAANEARAGDTIIIREGIYRERVIPPRGGTAGNYITYTSYPGETVSIRGSDIWTPNWKVSSGGAHYAVPNPNMFNDDNYKQGFYKNPFEELIYDYPSGFLDYTCGMVFVDGENYKEVTTKTQVENNEKSWYFDNPSGRLYINLPSNNPSSHEVEITTRRRIMAPKIKGLRYIKMTDLTFEHCGNMPMPWKNQDFLDLAGHKYFWSAVSVRSGSNWIFDRCIIQHTKSYGISLARDATRQWAEIETGVSGTVRAVNNTLRNSIIRYNGVAGVFIGGGRDKNGNDNPSPYGSATVYNCEFYNNNTTPGKYGNDANIKILSASHNNIYENSFVGGPVGVWVDWNCQGTSVRRNLIVGADKGVWLELNFVGGERLLVENNIMIGCEIGLDMPGSYHSIIANNMILDCKKEAIFMKWEKSRGDASLEEIQVTHNIFQNIAKNSIIYEKEEDFRLVKLIDNNIWDDDDTGFISTLQSFGYAANAKQQSMRYAYDTVNKVLMIDPESALGARQSPVWSYLDKRDYFNSSVNRTNIPGPVSNLGEEEQYLELWSPLVFPDITKEFFRLRRVTMVQAGIVLTPFPISRIVTMLMLLLEMV